MKDKITIDGVVYVREQEPEKTEDPWTPPEGVEQQDGMPLYKPGDKVWIVDPDDGEHVRIVI